MKSRTVLYHFIFWAAIYLLWIFIFRSYSFPITKTITIEFCYLVFITIDFYAINNLTVPQFLLKKKYALFILSTIAIVTVSAWLRALIAVQMNGYFLHIRQVEFSGIFLNSIINISLWVLLISIVKMLTDRVQTQQQLELLEKERIKNELDYLKAQINPHALLNSLNTIYGHIDKTNQAARNILLQFSELLKYQLYDCSAEKVNLGKEIAYIKNYIAFQRLRKEEKLIVDVDMDNIKAGLMIAPLLLVVLIENAFKFVSTFNEKENRISIRIFTKENILCASFINTKEFQQNTFNTVQGGIGIVNLKRRLALLYPEKHELTVTNDNDIYTTNLIIDLS